MNTYYIIRHPANTKHPETNMDISRHWAIVVNGEEKATDSDYSKIYEIAQKLKANGYVYESVDTLYQLAK